MNRDLLADAIRSDGPLVFLTGAGISAESGIPTFRGPEGYWRVGSRNYRPMELATAEAFSRMPEEVWRWYLYRRSVCRAAEPNAAHLALVRAEASLGERFLLVTQNVDGLHRRAGNSPKRTYEIHGNIDHCRCWRECAEQPDIRPLPAALAVGAPAERLARALTAEERSLLTCSCGSWLRPHVLWFDESYDERRFRFQSTLAAMSRASLLVVIGTSGATTLPTHMCQLACERQIPLLVLDPERTVFAELAETAPGGEHLTGPATALVPALIEALLASA